MYNDVVAEALPLDAAVAAAAAAISTLRVEAREVDLFVDDLVSREGAVVLLGQEGRWVVGLTHRANVDLSYPDAKLIEDGFGAAELAEHTLVLAQSPGCEGASCKSVTVPLVGSGGGVGAEVFVFDKHDLALVYFDPADVAGRPTLGLDQPTAAVKRRVRSAESMFGLSLSLMSDGSVKALREGIPYQSAGGQLLTLAAATALEPLVTSALGGFDAGLVGKLDTAITRFGVQHLENLIAPLFDRWEQPVPPMGPSEFTPSELRSVAVHRSQGVQLDGAGRVKLGGASHSWLGVQPGAGWSSLALASRVAEFTKDREVLIIEFEHPSGARPVLVVVPEVRAVLNLELQQAATARRVDQALLATALPALHSAAT